MLKNKKDLENENRLENIKELLSAMKEFDNLESFLEHVSLATSIDQDWDGEKVNMMTMHASKGLEFESSFSARLGRGVISSPKIYRGERPKWFGRGKKTCIRRNNQSKKKSYYIFSNEQILPR